jgi:hypothetical protein
VRAAPSWSASVTSAASASAAPPRSTTSFAVCSQPVGRSGQHRHPCPGRNQLECDRPADSSPPGHQRCPAVECVFRCYRSELDDLAHQAAADALLAITDKLGQFRGESRFTTWAYKFVIFEVSAKIDRRFWQRPTVPMEAED